MATNAVEAASASGLGAQACDAFAREYSRGQEFLEQAWAWVMDKGVEFLANLVMAILILVIGGLVVKLVTAIVRKALRRTKRVNALLESFLCSAVSKTGWIFLFVIALGRIGVDVGPLIAGLGVTGFILGFAFKDTLSNFASGIMIALNQPFKVGDYVIVGGVEGAVRELNMMATVIATADNKKIVIPNSNVWGGPVTNFSAHDTRRVDMSICIAYGADIDKARDVAIEAVKSLADASGRALALADPAPMAEVSSLDSSAIVLTVRAWCRTADYWDVFFGGNQAVKQAFDKAGVAIPFPQMDVHIKQA
ncbi:MAG: mechanosensitive ion channel family protein [Kiritimatiellae bacterium]|nr:mechanosensitive ion channel family protein [Kiritimatiellia bacterium]